MVKINSSSFLRLALLSLFLCSYTAYGSIDSLKQQKPPKKIKVLPVPSFGYSPETSTYIGAVSLFTLDFYHDSLTRTSNAKVEFTYTWRKQLILQSTWNYFFKHEKWYTQGNITYSRFPDLYYGIGESTPDSFETRYISDRINITFNALKKTGDRFFVGPAFRYINYYAIEYDTIPISFAELRNVKISGAGITLLKDTRNNLLTPGSGIYAELTATYNSTGDYGYGKILADLRTYHTKGRLTASARLLNDLSAGEPPFYDYAMIGNDNRVRGYYYGRFREKNMTTLQGELRSIIFRRLGAAVFGGITKMYGSVNELSFTKLKPNYGGGIRFLIDRKQNINLRLDYAIGSDGQDGFYVAFGESF